MNGILLKMRKPKRGQLLKCDYNDKWRNDKQQRNPFNWQQRSTVLKADNALQKWMIQIRKNETKRQDQTT
jgi:hypothetical protein